MRRAIQSVFVGAVLVFAASGLPRAESPSEKTVHVRCNLSVPSGVTEPMTMMAQVYRVGRDNLGKYQLLGKSQGLVVSLMPGEGGTGSGSFDTELELGNDVEYEFRVVPLDKDGYERTDGRYCFVGPEGEGDLYDKTVSLRPGEVNEVVVNLRWIPSDQHRKSNFMQVVPRPGRTDYFLALYLNDPTDIFGMN